MTASPEWQNLITKKHIENQQKITQYAMESEHYADCSLTNPISVLSIPRTCGVLTPSELDITETYDATALLMQIASGRLKSVDVARAFCKRATIAQQTVNCLTETMFEEAIERAKELDGYLERYGRTMGPLHGLPVSLKDSFNVKGVQSTIGYVSFLKHPPADHNSYLVDMLLNAGAVLYCKTNLSQSMMTADSHNNVFGRTMNPNKLTLTAGGSTGGEGALVKMRGSLLGMTTDIAGSNRIPALCNGVSSIKPTAGRIPFGGGVAPGRVGSPSSIVPVIGPTAHTVRDLELFLKTIIDAEPWNHDENVLAVPWRRVEPVTKPLRFGLIRGHAKRPLHPTISRALHTAVTAIEKAGHTIVLLDEKIPDLWECGLLAWKYFLLDPQKTPAKYLSESGEPWVPSIAGSNFSELRDWTPSLDKLFDMDVERAQVLKKYHDLFVKERLDAVVMAGYQATAVPHDTYGLPIYTSLQNLLNYPAGILPLLSANMELDKPFYKPDAAYEPPYDPEAVEGAPGAIQIMGKPMKDEELIEIMKAVETVLNPHQINSEPFIKPPQSRSRLSTEERRKLEIAFSSGRNLTN